MDQMQKKSYKMRWIAGVSVVVLLAIIGGTFLLVSQSSKNDKQASTSPSPKASTKVATKEDYDNDLSKLASNIKQATAAQDALKAALAETPKKIDTGN